MLEQESKDIWSKVAGWTETLSKPDLSSLIRAQVEQQLTVVLQRKQKIEVELDMLVSGVEHVDRVLDPKTAVDGLRRLDEVLAGGNPSDINVELSLHIESILVHPDGTVVIRTNRLGVFEGVSEILAGDHVDDGVLDGVDNQPNVFQIRQRALSRRHTTGPAETSKLAKADGVIEGHIDVPDKWVDEAIFQMPKLTSWSEKHAEDVAKLRKTGLTLEKLAGHFGKTVPTIRKALRLAAKTDESLKELPRKMPRARWHEDHAAEVAEMRAKGMGTSQLVERFGKSDTTIRLSLKHAQDASDQGTEDSEVADGSNGDGQLATSNVAPGQP